MTRLDEEAGAIHLKSLGIESLKSGSIERIFPSRFCYTVPKDTGRKTSLGKSLRNFLETHSSDVVILFSGWGTWPSCENMVIYDRIASSKCDSRKLYEAPYHRLTFPDDAATTECLIDVILYFYWDATLLDVSNQFAIEFTNDEKLFVYTEESRKSIEGVANVFANQGWKEC